MATTIINPAPSNDSSNNSNGVWFLIGAIILIVFGVLFLIFILPYLRGLGETSGIQVNVPKSIDVKIQQPK